MKKTSKALSAWSKNNIGDIFVKTQQLEERVRQCEETYMISLSQSDRMNLHQAGADLIQHYKQVDAFWRQRANLKWHIEGDENVKFFNLVARGM